MEEELRKLADEAAILKTVNRLFICTDNREWDKVKECFFSSVRFDMTSMVGGDPVTLTPEQIVNSWDEGLRGIEAIHHQTGNFMVDIVEDEAHAFCYGIAVHYLPNPGNHNTRSFVGSYDFGLARISGEWKIDQFKFNLKYVEGNKDLT